MIVKLEYKDDNFLFESETGRKLIMDENTPRPMELLLMALIGCTGIDIVEILNKMRVQYDRFEIIADGKRAQEHPRKYEYIKLIYKFYGKDLDKEREKIERAVSLSQNKYCSVRASLNSIVEYSIEIFEV
ncbi:MAG: OsmC family protein [candidate division WOR-3 bacterium]